MATSSTCGPTDAVRRFILPATTFLLPITALIVPLGVAPLFAVACIAVLACAWRDVRPWRLVPRELLLLLTALVAWGLVSAMWSDDAAQSAKGILKFGATILGGLLLVAALAGRGQGRHSGAALALVAGTVVALVVLDAEFLTGNWMSYLARLLREPETAVVPLKSDFSRGATIVTLLLWPVVLIMNGRWGRWPAIVLVGSSLAIFTLGESISSRLAVAAAAAAFVVVRFRPRAGLRLMQVAVVAVGLTMPAIAVWLPTPQETATWRWLPHSSHHRLTIWQFTARNAMQHPLRGWGMDASRWIPGADDDIRVWRWNGSAMKELKEPQLPLHPHNSVLQWWLELGVPGMVLILAFLWRVLDLVGTIPHRSERAAAAAMFAAGWAVSLVSYGFWQSWWQGGMWLSAAILAAVLAPRELSSGSSPSV